MWLARYVSLFCCSLLCFLVSESQSSGIHFQYWGGPILQSPYLSLIFYGDVPETMVHVRRIFVRILTRKQLTNFASSVGDSEWLAFLTRKRRTFCLSEQNITK